MALFTSKKVKGIDMTEGSPLKSLVLFAIPLILGDILQQVYNATDSIIVGRFVSKTALAAVGQTTSLINIFLGISIGISLGCTVCISRAFGEKSKENMADALNTVLRMTLLLAIALTAISVPSLPLLLKLIGTNADAYQDTYNYLFIYFLGISSQIAYNMFAGILRAVGDSRRPLIVLAITAVLNIGGDILMVKGFGMSTDGTALATVAAQAISAVILWFMIKNADAFESPIIRKQKMNKNYVKNIFKIGVPYALQRSIINFSNASIISFGNKLGSDFMAAWTIHAKLDQILGNVLQDLASALTTFVAQNIGAGKLDRIKQGYRTTLALAFGVDTVLVVFLILFARPLASLFTSDQAIIETTRMLFLIIVTFHPLCSMSNAAAGKLRGLNHSTGSLVFVIINFVIIRQIYLRVLWPICPEESLMLLFASAFPISYILNSIGVFIYEKIMSPRLIAKMFPDLKSE